MPQLSWLRDTPAEYTPAHARADGHVIVVTNDALTVASHDRLRLDVPIEEVRRIQFDIERERPATLVIVPDAPSSEPQVIMVQPDEYERVGHALAVLGMKMATMAD
jgi:predicted membrane GTPase involved in stress response